MSKELDKRDDSLENNKLFSRIADLIEHARQKVASVVNLTMVHTYFEVGRMIVEEEQKGKDRAEYGKAVLKELSTRLTGRFGKGFSEQNLRNMRQFFIVYADRELSIRQTPSSELESRDNHSSKVKSYDFSLNWSHYLILMRIENTAERNFYEIEATNENWSERYLSRQYHSSLYERLALSRKKVEVMKLASEGHTVVKPEDILKNPLSLEFLGMEEKDSYTESDMEHAIISKLQQFLLELGKGFLFEARQKQFTFDDEHYFVDLVFYNRLLQCYVLIDLKTDKLTHQDLGQMQMYVNYYDRYEKREFEKPTIGILLCKKKTTALVELTLPEDAHIYASEYTLYLPDKKILQQKLTEWIIEYDDLNKD